MGEVESAALRIHLPKKEGQSNIILYKAYVATDGTSVPILLIFYYEPNLSTANLARTKLRISTFHRQFGCTMLHVKVLTISV